MLPLLNVVAAVVAACVEEREEEEREREIGRGSWSSVTAEVA